MPKLDYQIQSGNEKHQGLLHAISNFQLCLFYRLNTKSTRSAALRKDYLGEHLTTKFNNYSTSEMILGVYKQGYYGISMFFRRIVSALYQQTRVFQFRTSLTHLINKLGLIYTLFLPFVCSKMVFVLTFTDFSMFLLPFLLCNHLYLFLDISRQFLIPQVLHFGNFSIYFH